MNGFVQKRGCRQFEIPGARVRLKRNGFSGLVKRVSPLYPILCLSKGGLIFLCGEALRRNEKVFLQLQIPKTPSLDLHARIRWPDVPAENGSRTTAAAFITYGPRRGWNSREALHALRVLEERYSGEPSDPVSGS